MQNAIAINHSFTVTHIQSENVFGSFRKKNVIISIKIKFNIILYKKSKLDSNSNLSYNLNGDIFIEISVVSIRDCVIS